MSLTVSMKKIVGCLLLLIALSDFPTLVTAVHDEDESPANQGCIDSTSQFLVWKKTNMRWSQVKMKCRSARRNKNFCYQAEFKRNCPLVCDTCPDKCKDRIRPFKTNNNGEQTCDDTNADSLCAGYRFARLCPVRCEFCPTLAPTVSPAPTAERGFVKIDKKDGLFNKGFLGHGVAMTSFGNQIFVAELNRDTDKTDILEYSGSKMRWNPPPVAHLGSAGRTTQIETSRDGQHVIVTYRTTEDKVAVYRRNGTSWTLQNNFRPSSRADIGFGQSIDISDDGEVILIASKVSVRVFDSNHFGRTATRIMGDVISASMTSDGNIVAISESDPTSIKVYRWINDEWYQEGNDIAPLANGIFGIFNNVKISDNGKTLITSTSGIRNLRGAVYVFDLVDDGMDSTWQRRNEGNGLVIKGTKADDRLGRNLSISRDGKFVAWGSNSRAGVLKWTGYEWQDEGVLAFSKRPRVALDPEGKHLAVGLPFKRVEDLANAGVIFVYKWAEPTSSPSSEPTSSPSSEPTPSPTPKPTPSPTTPKPTPSPTHEPTPSPTHEPTPISASPSRSFLPSSQPSQCFHGDCFDQNIAEPMKLSSSESKSSLLSKPTPSPVSIHDMQV